MRPLYSFPVRLGLGFWVRVHLWESSAHAPDNGDGRDAAYFLVTDEWPRKLGDVHLGRNWLDVETVTHEAYHVVAELRRRVDGTNSHRGEEWCAAQLERIVGRVVAEMKTRGEVVR